MMDGPTDVEQIQRVIARYSTTCDDGQFDVFATLFTTDGEFYAMGTSHRGRDAIEAFIASVQPPESRGRHVTTNTVIDIHPSGDGASATTDYLFVTRAKAGGFEITNVGRYHDRFVRDIDGEWRFRRREIVFLGDQPDPG